MSRVTFNLRYQMERRGFFFPLDKCSIVLCNMLCNRIWPRPYSCCSFIIYIAQVNNKLMCLGSRPEFVKGRTLDRKYKSHPCSHKTPALDQLDCKHLKLKPASRELINFGLKKENGVIHLSLLDHYDHPKCATEWFKMQDPESSPPFSRLMFNLI